MTDLRHLAWVIPSAWVLYKIVTFGSREKALPPGPPTIPILGNAHQIPIKEVHLKFKEWAEQYGSIYSLKVGGTTMIILSDREAVFELLSRQGAHFNSRPPNKQIETALGNENVGLMAEGSRWRTQRKVISTYFSPKNLDSVLEPILAAEVSHLMLDLLNKPEQFRNNVKRTTASVGTDILFAQRAPHFDSFWVQSVYRSVAEQDRVLAPGNYLPMDNLPILKLLPDRWNPPLQAAKEAYRNVSSIWGEARDRVEERRRHGDKRESLLDRILDGQIEFDEPHNYNEVNNFFGTVQAGSADTTAGHTLTSILFLAQHPEVQEKAHQELDRVCGTDRMPMWSDFADLPYINCIVKEGLRMRAAVPAGVPHLAKKDTWYKGMLIPKGCQILVPPTVINHDQRSMADHDVYNPDRFLPVAGKLAPELASSSKWGDRDHYSYGVGRRLCAGINLAERIQWRMMAQMLWAFRIERDGELDTGYGMYHEGFIHFVKDFKARFVPRSEKHAEMVRAQFAENEALLRSYD